jgi:hypothetical protein
MHLFFLRLFFVTLILFTIATGAELDLILSPQRSFYSAGVKSLGDAGVANPIDLTSGFINPALVYSYLRKNNNKKGNISTGYGRDSLFDAHIIPFGIGYCTGDGALGGFYRALISKQKRIQNEFVVNMSGMLFAPSLDESGNVAMGQVDFGLNFRYDIFSWKTRTLGPFDSLPAINDAKIKQKRLILDMGLYQSNIANNLDFALTIRNLLGYLWTDESPVVKDSLHKEFLPGGDSIVNSVPYYSYKTEKNKGWLENEYRTLTLGIVYHMGGGAYQVSIPIDFEMLGLFDKHVRNLYVFRGGIEVTIQKHFSIRLGYSRTPGPIQSAWNEVKKMNVFTGGAGIAIDPVALDFYLSDGSFGTSVSCNF